MKTTLVYCTCAILPTSLWNICHDCKSFLVFALRKHSYRTLFLKCQMMTVCIAEMHVSQIMVLYVYHSVVYVVYMCVHVCVLVGHLTLVSIKVGVY